MSKEQKPEKQPPTADEVRDALRKSGYPLEVLLFNKFKATGLSAVMGLRMAVNREGETNEVDLLVSLHNSHSETGLAAWIEQRAVIQVKNLPEAMRLVGVLGEQPSDHERRVVRVKAPGGLPSARTIKGMAGQSELDGLLLPQQGAIGNAFEPHFEAAPHCPHWAVVEYSKKEKTMGWWAHGKDEFRGAIRSAVQGAYWHRQSSTRFLLGTEHDPFPRMSFYYPTLIVGTPEMFVYEPEGDELRSVEWFVYRCTLDLGAGDIFQADVDVVTEAGVDAMIDRYQRTNDNLEPVVKECARQLVDLSQTQRRWYREHQSGGSAATEEGDDGDRTR